MIPTEIYAEVSQTSRLFWRARIHRGLFTYDVGYRLSQAGAIRLAQRALPRYRRKFAIEGRRQDGRVVLR